MPQDSAQPRNADESKLQVLSLVSQHSHSILYTDTGNIQKMHVRSVVQSRSF